MTTIDRPRSSAKHETWVYAQTLTPGDKIALDRYEWMGWTYYTRRYAFRIESIETSDHPQYGHIVCALLLDDGSTLTVPGTCYLARFDGKAA